MLAAINKLAVELPDPPRVAQLDKEEPVTIVSPEEMPWKVKAAGLSSAGSFGLFVFLIAWLEFRSRRGDSFENVEAGLEK